MPEDAALMRWVEETARNVFCLFGFGELRTPILEETEVFTRSIGTDTDIVEKEMYSFTDRGGKNVSMRPEGTASMIRAYIEHGMHNSSELVKLFYFGPMFRGERPQKGRLRQFHQIGAEAIGGKGPYVDAEMIFSLNMILGNLGLSGYTILINSLGCDKDRAAYRKTLLDWFAVRLDGLCEDCRRRSKVNVLRVLDCKRESCKAVAEKAPSMTESLCPGCSRDHAELKQALSSMNVPFTEKKDLVRGLDYYTGTIFEVVHTGLGSQDAIAAGGRYDGLSRQLGGPDTGAIGYAIGVERLLLILGREKSGKKDIGPLVIPADVSFAGEAFSVTNRLRSNGVSCETDLLGRSMKGLMRKANREGRRYVVIIGEEEKRTGRFFLKDMTGGVDQSLSFEELAVFLKKQIDRCV